MTEQEFREKLNPEQYRVLREKGTEAAYSGKYWDNDEPGTYACAACGSLLFFSFHKLDARNGWPTFGKPLRKSAVELVKEKDGRTEVQCGKCKSHIGYIEGHEKRYRTNSVALDFIEVPEFEAPEMEEEKERAQASDAGSAVSTAKVATLAIGGIMLGAAAGASGAAYLLEPKITACELGGTQATTTAPLISPDPEEVSEETGTSTEETADEETPAEEADASVPSSTEEEMDGGAGGAGMESADPIPQ